MIRQAIGWAVAAAALNKSFFQRDHEKLFVADNKFILGSANISEFYGDKRFGKPFRPREWFLAPLELVEQAIAMLEDGSIVGHRYDGKLGKIVKQT